VSAASLREGLRRYVDARSRAVAVRQLARLSDQTLRSLGVERSHIGEFVRNRALPWS